jgi:hypothetical protein
MGPKRTLVIVPGLTTYNPHRHVHKGNAVKQETWVALAGVLVAALSAMLGFIGGRRLERSQTERMKTELQHNAEESRRGERRQAYERYLADSTEHEVAIIGIRHLPGPEERWAAFESLEAGRFRQTQASLRLVAAERVRRAETEYEQAMIAVVRCIAAGVDESDLSAALKQLGLAHGRVEHEMRMDLGLGISLAKGRDLSKEPWMDNQ